MNSIQHATTAARCGHELLTASSSVISRRLEIAAEAVRNPLQADYPELLLMGSEKVEAMTASAAAGLSGAMAFAETMNQAVSRESRAAQGALHDLARSDSAAGALEVQGRWALGLVDRAVRNSWTLGAAMLELQADALAPIHAAATANARRLRRPD